MLDDIKESEWRWVHFTRDEMKCKGIGECRMCPDFMDLLEKIRVEYGNSLIITSGYRSPEHNASVSHTGASGPHTTGKAVDIAISGKNAYKLIKTALENGITGIGVSQKGTKRFVHLDALDGNIRPNIWSY